MEQMIKVAEAASQLGVHPNTIRNMIKDGRIPAYRVGTRTIRLKPSEVASAVGAN